MKAGNKQLLFFFTPAELSTVLKAFDTCCVCAYHKAGMFSSPEIPVTLSLAKEPLLENLTIGDWNHSPTYLITPPKADIVVRKITLRKGGSSYAVDQLENPDSLLFKSSGIFSDGILIAGSLGTVSSAIYSINTFQILAKVIKKHASRIGNFYVGSEAKEKLALGWRLVTNASSPKEYDLALK